VIVQVITRHFVEPIMRGVFVVLLLCGSVRAAGAQGGRARPNPLPAAQVCDMRFKLLELRVQDATAKPVAGVLVTLRRDGQTDAVRSETTSSMGLISIADDTELPRVPPKGAPYTITLRKGNRTRRVPIRLGPDSSGCHIALLSGSSVVTF
jgi:hypothetical protein